MGKNKKIISLVLVILALIGIVFGREFLKNHGNEDTQDEITLMEEASSTSSEKEVTKKKEPKKNKDEKEEKPKDKTNKVNHQKTDAQDNGNDVANQRQNWLNYFSRELAQSNSSDDTSSDKPSVVAVNDNQQPTKPEEPATPGATTEPTKPEEPATPGATTEPTKPEEPATPGTTTEPTKPEEPATPGATTEPTKPEEPATPGATTEPTKPEEPATPGATTEPTKPEEPATPGTTTEPTKPEEPATPGATTEPTKPEEPATPGATTEPTKPEEPATPGTTTEPTKPEEPTTPGEVTEPVKKENILLATENSNLKVCLKSSTKSIDEVKSELLSSLDEEHRSKVYFASIFADENKILVLDTEHLLTINDNTTNDLLDNAVLDGVYVTDNNNNLLHYKAVDQVESRDGQSGATAELATLPDNDELGKNKDIILFVGKVNYPNRTIAAKRIIGYPGNEAHIGVSILSDSQLVEGVNFYAKDTSFTRGQNDGFIAVTKEEPVHVTITHNTFHFDPDVTISKALVGFTAQGEIDFSDNKIEGKALFKYGSSTKGVVHFNQRSKKPFKLTIENNQFKDIKPAAIRVMVGEYEDVIIKDNFVDGVDDSGIVAAVFPVEYPKQNKLSITGNTVNNYGLGVYENYQGGWGGPLTAVNTEEGGICVSSVEVSYGMFINNTWISSEQEVFTLIDSSNKVMDKIINDKNENVVDSTAIYLSPKGRFVNAKDRINKQKYGNSKHIFVITKHENGTVTYGQNPEDLAEEIEVGGVFITGEGSGLVILPSTLKIKGDLVIDLPNASVQNHAIVQGKTTIHAESQILNDAVFSLVTKDFIRAEAPQDGLQIKISDVKSDTGEAIAAQDTNWSLVEVLVNGQKLADDQFSIDEDTDSIYIPKRIADEWQEKVKVMVRIASTSNKISTLNSSDLFIRVLDYSNCKLELNKDSIIHMNPTNEEIVVSVKDIKDKFGNPVSAEDSKLEANVLKFGNKLAPEYIKIDDTKDEITLTADFLKILPATSYTQMINQNLPLTVTESIVVSAPTNNVGEKEVRLPIKVVDHSKATFEFDQGLTYTQGHAPKEGITLYIKDIVDASGKKVTAKDSVIKGNINVEPFPVSRDDTPDSELIVVRDEEGNFVREIFNPKYLIIDDERDTITFTQEYLNKMNTNSFASTEFGMKVFTFIYQDRTSCVDMRSSKTPLYIKKVEAPKSTDLSISFKEGTFKLTDGKLVANGSTLSEDTMVSTIYAAVIKNNPRQQVLIQATNGEIRPDFASLDKGDMLLIKAEDTSKTITYPIELADSSKDNLITKVDKAIVLEYDHTSMKVKSGISVNQLLAAITVANDVKAAIVSEEQATSIVDGTSQVKNQYKLQLTKNGETYLWNLVPLNEHSQSRAILIGNWDYPGEETDLIGPKNDLGMMEVVFNGNNLNNHKTSVTKLMNVQKQALIEGLQNAFVDATEDDISYIYYSGHGNNIDGLSYICTVDDKVLPDGHLDPSGWVSVNELRAVLDKVPGKKVLILDCCNAGGFIGKKAVGINERTITENDAKATAQAFLADVERAFTSNTSDRSINYLTTNDYKVLVASSSNEYSYEDKKTGRGKFTRSLAVAAGLENNYMAGDSNKDRILDLDEAYRYLMANVASISHIQVFPYQEAYPLFENVKAIPLSNNTLIKSDDYQVFKKGKRGMIKAKKDEVISSERTVAEFLASFTKGEEHQQLAVGTISGDRFVAMSPSEQLGTGLRYLKVVAQNGETTNYAFTAKAPLPKSTNTDISVTDPEMEFIVTKFASAIKLSKKITVKEFLAAIKKGHEKQTLTIYPKKGNIAKQETDTIEYLDRLIIVAEDGETQRKVDIQYIPKANLTPAFGNSFTVKNQQIISSNVKITTNMTVGEFLSYWSNKADLAHKIDAFPTAIYPKGAYGPFAVKKRPNEQLAVGDIFRLVPNVPAHQQQPVDFQIIVEEASIPVVEPSIEVPLPNWGWRCKLAGDSIVEDGEFLNNSVKYGTLVGRWLENAGEYTSFEFYDANGQQKQASDFLENGATIKFFKGEASKTYTVKFNTGGLVVPPINVGGDNTGGLVVPPINVGGDNTGGLVVPPINVGGDNTGGLVVPPIIIGD